MAEPDDQFVPLRKARNSAIAGLWVSVLEDAGIPTWQPAKFLTDEWAATQSVATGLGSEVCVPRSRLREAEEVLRAAGYGATGTVEPAPSGPTATCSACGELIEPGFAACWKCGLAMEP
jgi:hypothetical protein